jgi:hypothetical protein
MEAIPFGSDHKTFVPYGSLCRALEELCEACSGAKAPRLAYLTRALCFGYLQHLGPVVRRISGHAWSVFQVSNVPVPSIDSTGLKHIHTRFSEGDFATLSHDPARVINPDASVRAQMEFEDGMPFGHVLRVLKIIHEVSPSYFVAGVSPALELLRSNSDVFLLGKLLFLCFSYCQDAEPTAWAKPK